MSKSKKPSLSVITGVKIIEPEEHVCDLLEWTFRSGERHKPTKVPLNIEFILTQDSRWIGRIRRNTFIHAVEVDGDTITDEVAMEAVLWMAKAYKVNTCRADVLAVMMVVGKRNPYHPVVDYLKGLEWDGKERLPTMLPHYFRSPNTSMIRKVGVKWMISCVARMFAPGCQADSMLILTGKQGAGKSTAVKMLCHDRDWFTDERLDVSGKNKDSLQLLSGHWIIEFGEMNGLRAVEAIHIKGFLTKTVDKFRPPYGRSVQKFKRQNIFIGTTNEDHFLADPTGSRRFWPVPVRRVRMADIVRDRDHLWAEAVARYHRGEPWHLSNPDEEQLQRDNEEYSEEDPWQGIVGEWFETQLPGMTFTAYQILTDVLEIPKERQGRRHQNRLGSILKTLGVERAGRLPKSQGQARLWRKPAPASA